MMAAMVSVHRLRLQSKTPLIEGRSHFTVITRYFVFSGLAFD
jgi:hypothetical protein